MALGRPIQLTGNVASKVIRVLATEGQTVFTVTGGYRINQIGVFRNGVRLSNNSDFTALDGVTVTLTNPAVLNDEVLFQIQDDFRVADAIVGAASSQTIHGDLAITGNLFVDGGQSGVVTTLDGADGSKLTGVVTSITAGDNISVSGATGNVTITGLANTSNVLADTLVVTGVSTLAAFTATSGTISGDLSVGGVLTYEDVANVDSVGLITARSGIRVLAGGATVVGVSTFNDDIKGDGSTNISGISSVTSTTLFGDTSEAVSGTWTLGADGTNNYTFTGPGLIGAENDPVIYVQRGMIYQFVNGMNQHPFQIQSTAGQGGTAYNDGITNNGVQNGTLIWKVQMDSPDTLYYQCTSHANMGGEIKVGGGGGGGAAYNVMLSSFLN